MIQYDVDKLSITDIKDLLDNNAEVKENIRRYKDNLRYFTGDNPFIIDRTSPDPNAPNNKVPIPYGRKIIKAVSGYMYKPGLITYATENDKYKTIIDEIFDYNDEDIETSQLGEQTSLQGMGFELHYIDKAVNNIEGIKTAMPRFTKIPAEQMIPIWDYSIEPKLITCLRHFKIGKVVHVYVYYPDVVEHYIREDEQKDFTEMEFVMHYYKQVPVVVYQNNEEMVGDFEPVKYLIDAYDVLASDSMNEFDRFSWAYLLLKGFSMSDEDAKNAKWKRAFENLATEDSVAFLTKEIPHEFIQFMSDWFRDEIHKQTHVPNFLEYKTGDQMSGVAISKALYDFEMVAATKEAYFKKALKQRFDLIDQIIKIRDGALAGSREDIEIIMTRNKPQEMKENAEIFGMYSGHISEKTLMENFAPFVKDAEEEIDALKKEQDAKFEMDLDKIEAKGGAFNREEKEDEE